MTKKAAKRNDKYYVVRVGQNPGIYTTWSEAEQQIKGFLGAEHRAFKLKKDAQSYFRKRKNAEVAKPKDDGQLIRHDINTSQKVTNPGVIQEGASANLIPDDLITLDEYEDDELSYTDESKREINNIWDDCDLLWDLQQEGKERMDRIESLLGNRTRKEIGNDTPNVNEFYPSTPVLYEQSSLTPEVQDKEGDFTGNCYTPTSELKKEITDLKEKNHTLLDENNRLRDHISSISQQNQQLSEENNNLTKEIQAITKDKEAVNERIIILEHAITAVSDENNELKMNDWKMVNHSRKRTRSDNAISVHETEDISTSNRYEDLQKEKTGTDENVMDYSKFFSSQRSLRRKELNQSHSVSNSEGYEDRSNIPPRKNRNSKKKKVVVLGDSQLKYVKGENLANKNLNVTVKSISGLKVEQVVDKFSYDLNRCSEAYVLIHAGTNNVQLCSVATLLDSYEKLAMDLKEKCDKMVFSSIIQHNDRPELNSKIEILNDGIYEICRKHDIDFINNDNITATNLARDGLHINRSGQIRLTANFLQLFS